MLDSLFRTVLVMSATGSMVYVLILALRPITDQKFSRTWSYYVRLLIVLFLLAPVGLLGGAIYSRVAAAAPQPVLNAVEYPVSHSDFYYFPDTVDAAGVSAEQTISIIQLLPYAWLIGMAAFVLRKATALYRFRRKLRETGAPVTDESTVRILDGCEKEMGIKKPLEMTRCDGIGSPMLTGLMNPRLILPKADMDERELRMIVRHELTHFKRGDLLIKAAALTANVLHWFNPFAYLLTKDIDRLCEQSCDEAVVRDMDTAGRKFYGKTILNMMSQAAEPVTGLSAPLCGKKEEMQRRLAFMMNVKRTPKKIAVLSLAVAVILCAAGFTAASAASAKAGISNGPPSVADAGLQNTAGPDAETLPSAAPSGTADAAPTASPQNGSAENDVEEPAAEQLISAADAGAGSQSPAPASENIGGTSENSAQDGYPVNQYGWTYGNASMREALGLDCDAYLMEAVGTKGQSGYIRTTDRESNMPSAPDESRTIPLFDADGSVIGAFVLSSSESVENGVYLSSSQEPSYPRNSKGETYGSDLMAQALGYEPDLVAALGTEGQSGYIREEDIPGANVSSPEEAMEYMEYMKTLPSTIMIPLYDQEGNVIGEFGVSNGNGGIDPESFDSLEEAREAVANGG